jgi:hypothetical protein
MISRGGRTAWPPRSLDLTPPDFTLWDFRDIVYMPLMPNSTEELNIWISQAML